MERSLTFLGIAGSLRKGSYNRAALRAAQRLAPPQIELKIFDIAGLPHFNQDEEHEPPPRLVTFKRAIRDADAILFATPEYNYSIPGVLKNAIDCASRPYGDSAWAGKPVALMSASIGAFGGMRAQRHLRHAFVYLDMYAVNQPRGRHSQRREGVRRGRRARRQSIAETDRRAPRSARRIDRAARNARRREWARARVGHRRCLLGRPAHFSTAGARCCPRSAP